MLSNINMYSSLLGAQHTNVSSSEKVASTEATPAAEKTDGQHNGNLSLSTKAQKLSAINSEFFNGKPFASVDTQKLIDRVYEYGLISKTEYASLSDKPTDADAAAVVESTSTQSLSKFVNGFKERLDDVDGYQESEDDSVVALKQALNNAADIFNDVEQTKKSREFKSMLADTKETLTTLISSDEFSAMPLGDRVDMTNVIKTLDIVDKINIKRLDNPMINRYINVANY